MKQYCAVGGWVAQLWLFRIAPIAGAVLGALVYRFIADEHVTGLAGIDPIAEQPVRP